MQIFLGWVRVESVMILWNNYASFAKVRNTS